MSSRRVHLRIKGLVQGVCYRATACDAALSVGVRGWVRNLASGDVEAVAEGESGAVDRFVEWCRRGPEEADVTGVAVTEEPATGEFSTFRVVR